MLELYGQYNLFMDYHYILWFGEFVWSCWTLHLNFLAGKACLFKNLPILTSHSFIFLKEKKCKMNIVLLAFNFMKICSMLQSRCIRKAGRIKITAKFELKPPPYPLVRSKFVHYSIYYPIERGLEIHLGNEILVCGL